MYQNLDWVQPSPTTHTNDAAADKEDAGRYPSQSALPQILLRFLLVNPFNVTTGIRPSRFLHRIFGVAPPADKISKAAQGPRARDSSYFDAVETLDDGDGDLVDDEGCFVDSRETTALDIISFLPNELVLEVLDYLDVGSLLACSCVSKYWRLFALDSQVWRRLFSRNRGWKVNNYDLVAHDGSVRLRRDWRALYRSRWTLERRWTDASFKPKEIKLVGHTDSVYCIDTDPRRNILVSGSRDRTIKFWDMSTGVLVTTFERHHSGSVLCLKVDFTRGSKGFMVSGSSDRSVLVWEVDFTGWSGQQKKISSRKEVTGKTVAKLEGHGDGVLDLKMDANWIVSCSKDALVRVWSLKTLEVHAILAGHDGPINAVGLQGNRLVSASGDGKMILWDIEAKAMVRTLEGHIRGLACVDFKGDNIVSGSNDRQIKVWSAQTGECLATVPGHDQLVRALSFDSSFGRLLSASYDMTIKMWKVDERDPAMPGTKATTSVTAVRKFEEKHTSHIFDVKFDARRIISSSHDQNIVILDFGEGLDTSPFM